jgi:hypothetical protein
MKKAAYPSSSYGEPGMSLRDWYAGLAMAALITEYNNLGDVCEDAWRIADLMIEKRGE